MAEKKIAVVTGASSGLGLCISQKLLLEGWSVIGLSRTMKNWPAAVKKINSGEFLLNRLDLSDEKAVSKWFAENRKLNDKVSVLINNAGIVHNLKRVEDLTSEEVIDNIAHNYYQTFYLCRKFIPLLKLKNSWIINISSMAGKRAVPLLGAYSAAKAAVLVLGQAVAKENLDTSMKCITICLGGLNTAMRARLYGKEDAKKQQSPEYISDVIYDIIRNEIKVPTGGDICIRHGKITAINPPEMN